MSENNSINKKDPLEYIKCPFCRRIQKKMSAIKSWLYGGAEVTRFECQCGNNFNYFKSKKSTWTIPKRKS